MSVEEGQGNLPGVPQTDRFDKALVRPTNEIVSPQYVPKTNTIPASSAPAWIRVIVPGDPQPKK